jgi:hypothetical protein
MKKFLGLLLLGLTLLGAAPALAANCSTYPYTLTNGQTADANQVMANFNSILSCANTGLLPSPLTGTQIITGLGYTPLDIAGSNSMTGTLVVATGTTGLAPLVIPAGTLKSVLVSGAIENDGTNLYYTTSVPGRHKLAPLDSPAFTGSTPTINGTALVLTTDSRFLGPTQNIQCGYTLLITDAGNEIYCNTAGTHTTIIPANASVAFVLVTKIEIINDCSAGVMTITITSDTLSWAPSGATGSRSLQACGVASLTKVASTRWVITGTGLS